ncbi:Up-regulated during septation-domain-containing protein [Cyathus striatus]|nr:Up-regulated during septation-domain-containing protein [Cyathus striatus]
MNGVRRLLGAATASSPPSPQADSNPLNAHTLPLAFSPKSGPTWPPQSPATTHTPFTESPKGTAALLFSKKDKQKSQSSADDDLASPSFQSPRSSNGYPLRTPPKSSPSSPRISPPTQKIPRKSVPEPEWKRTSGMLDTRDELLISLLASEAVVESREFEILSAEEVEELKKVTSVSYVPLVAMTKKLSLETKIRDAAVTLSKVNASHKKISKQTEEQLDAANKRVEAAQKELWRVSERTNEVQRKLMEHRAGKKMNPPASSEDSGYDSNRSTLMSPASSNITSASSTSRLRFDGAHLFAGHADAVVPKKKLSSEAAAQEISSLEEKLKAATDSLTAASRKQAEMSRELSMMKLEKQEVETMIGMELQSAEETISALQQEIPRIEKLDAEALERDREEQGKELEMLQARLADLELRSTDEMAELEEVQREWDADRAAWDQERAAFEDEKMDDLQRLQEEMERLRTADQAALDKANQELDGGLASLAVIVKDHGIVLFSRDSGIQGMLEGVGMHLAGVHGKLEAHAKEQSEWDATRRRLEDDVRNGLDKRESLTRELELARRELDTVRRETMNIETRVKQADAIAALRSPAISRASLPQQIGATATTDLDVSKVLSALFPIWNILPSPEARAAKFSNSAQRPFRTGSPTTTRSSGAVTSLSDLDVRSLKVLYNEQQNPGSPKLGNGTFSIEAFAQRVQALINDDRALIERLVRFAQAHDLLKKNAERAQKLAQDGNLAMETYQKQVRILEERNMSFASRQAAMQEEIQQLQDTIDRIAAEKQEVEMLAAEQAETCRQLTEANNTLSARTLSLAHEAADAPEKVRKQLEAQLAECKAALEAAQDEIDAMRTSEQSQRIALLDELNSMQTENGALRAQLRASGKK